MTDTAVEKQIFSHQDCLSYNETGSLTGMTDYEAFGKPVIQTGSFASESAISDMLFGYTGKPYNATTGLSDYGYRDYSPQLARFTTSDPVRDGSNWYAYVNGDPVNYVDLWGLEANDKTNSDLFQVSGRHLGESVVTAKEIYTSGETKVVIASDGSIYVSSPDPVSVVIAKYDGNENIPGAKTGTVEVYSNVTSLDTAFVKPDFTSPFVSGNSTTEACKTGVWFDLEPDNPQSKKLQSEAYGGPDNTLLRLYDSVCMHQGIDTPTANIKTSYTESCIAITVAEGKQGSGKVIDNYDTFKKAAGEKSIVIVQ